MSKEDLIEAIKNKSEEQIISALEKPEWLDDPEVKGLFIDRPGLLMQILKRFAKEYVKIVTKKM